MTCKTHPPGVGEETIILSITPALPGWTLAGREKAGALWFQPIAAWALVEQSFNADGCSCRDRDVRAMVAGERGRLELADPADESAIVPPGHVARWASAATPARWCVVEAPE